MKVVICPLIFHLSIGRHCILQFCYINCVFAEHIYIPNTIFDEIISGQKEKLQRNVFQEHFISLTVPSAE